jgi:hypothetical protein
MNTLLPSSFSDLFLLFVDLMLKSLVVTGMAGLTLLLWRGASEAQPTLRSIGLCALLAESFRLARRTFTSSRRAARLRRSGARDDRAPAAGVSRDGQFCQKNQSEKERLDLSRQFQ